MKSAIFFTALSLAAPADAQAPANNGVTISGEASLLSDFRFRGISRSDRDPAVQGALTVAGDAGWYVGARATSLHRAGAFGDVQGEVYAGYSTALDLATTVDAGLRYFIFPDGDGATDYVEPYVSLSHQLGPMLGTIGANYAPDQAALGGEGALYLFGEVEAALPGRLLTFTAQAGRQNAGAFADYWTWSLGARYDRGPLFAGLRYVDTDLPALPNAKAGLVLQLGAKF